MRRATGRVSRPLAAFVLALGLLGGGLNAPFAKDAEPQSAQWIADIVQNGHWLVPRDYYGFVDRKPPLYYWLSALAANAVARPVNESLARVVSLVAGAALATLVLEWGAAALDSATGWLAFVMLIGSYAFASRAVTALTDMLMTLLLFAAWCVVGRMLDQPRTWRSVGGASVLLGLAILTKGPVTIAIVALALALMLLLERRNPLPVACAAWPWAMVLVAIAIGAAWYVPAAIVGRTSDLTGVFVSENLGHFMPAAMGGTGEAARPVYYIVMRLVSGMLPLSLLLPAVALAYRSDGYRAETRQPLLLQLALALAVVILFSAASAKRDDYILPAIPPLAILFAALFTTLRPSAAGRHGLAQVLRDTAAGLIGAASILAIVGALVWSKSSYALPEGPALLQSSDASYAAIFVHGLAAQRSPFVMFEVAVTSGAMATLVGVLRGRGLLTGAGVATIALAGSLLWNAVVRPIEMRTRSLVDFAADVRKRVGERPVYVAYFDPEFAWYFGRGVPPLPRAIALEGAPTGQPAYFVARPKELARLAPAVRERLRLVTRTPLLGGGGPPSLYALPPRQGPGELNASPPTIK